MPLEIEHKCDSCRSDKTESCFCDNCLNDVKDKSYEEGFEDGKKEAKNV